MMAKIDEIMAEAQAGHDYYKKYNEVRAIVEEKQSALEFKVAKTTISFRCDWSGPRIYIGSADFNRAEAIALVKGILERLTDPAPEEAEG